MDRLGLNLSRLFARIVPDPWVIAVLLSAATFVVCASFGSFPAEPTPPESWTDRAATLLSAWSSADGLWKLLAFSMQMCLVLVTGHALASSRPVAGVLAALAAMPRSGPAAAAMVGAVACLTGIVNWGFGLIAGAILARETGLAMRRRGIPAHYPLLVAAGYTGLFVWHGGFSGSAPLGMTTPASMARMLPPDTLGTLKTAGFAAGVPLDQTLLSPLNLVTTGLLLVLVPGTLFLLAPRRAAQCAPPPAALELHLIDPAPTPGAHPAPRKPAGAERLDHAPWVAWLLAVPLLVLFGRFVIQYGWRVLGLNEVSALMLALGLLLHGSLASYAKAAEEAGAGCVGIVLQFPLYAGIVAMLAVSGFVEQFSEWIASFATTATHAPLTYLAACVVGFLVPSGGAQWTVQGPIALDSGLALSVPPGTIIMAVAYGDQVANMVQPFWALPLLAITRVKAREIAGYCFVVMLVGAAWMGLTLWLFR